MGQLSNNRNQNSGRTIKRDRIRVLRIIARMNIGGPAVQVTGLMQNLNQEKFDHKLITGFVTSYEADYLIENSIDLPLTRIDGLGRSIKPMADLSAFLKLIKIAREFKPHIIHTHTAKAGVLGRLVWIFLGYKPKLIHTFHGHLLNGYFGKFKTQIVISIEKILGAFTDKFFAVGNQVAKDLIYAGIGDSKKYQVMKPGLSIGPIPDRTFVAMKYKLDPSQFYCTYLGRVTDIKEPRRFLEIARHAKKLQLPINFLLVGSGELLNECKALISHEKLLVTCLGWVYSVEEILALTDIMILTSKNEGMPLSLIQAGMAGKPTISTDVGSVSEVILNDVTGYVLPYNPSLFIEKIKLLQDEPMIYAKIAKAAREFTLENFSVLRLAKDHEVAYLNLLNQE